jgi:glutaredoxin
VIRLTLYSRPGCHLCDEMKAVIERVRGATTALVEVDISRDAALEARYGTDIPVLEIDGTRIAKYRVSENDLRRAIAARQGAARPG